MKYEKRPLEKVGRFLIDRRHPLENRTASLRSVKSILSTACRPLSEANITRRRQAATTLGAKPRQPSHRRCVRCLNSQNHLFPHGKRTANSGWRTAELSLATSFRAKRSGAPKSPHTKFLHRWSIRSMVHCQSEV